MVKKIIRTTVLLYIFSQLSGCTLMYEVFGPPVPADLKVDKTTSFTVHISWKMDQKFEYLISYTSSDGTDTQSDIPAGTLSSYVLDNLKPYTEYTITLKSSFKDKISDESHFVKAKTLINYPSSISVSAESKDTALISWSSVPFADGYVLFYDTNSTFSNNLSIDCKADNFYILSGLKESTEYYFAVTAYTGEGNGDRSPAELFSTVVADYVLGFYEVPPSENSLVLSNLTNNRIFMVKMNPSASLVRASNTRYILNDASSKNYRSITSDPLLDAAVKASEAGNAVSGIWDSGFIRYDKTEPQDFLKELPEVQPLLSSHTDKTSAVNARAVLNDVRSFWVENASGLWVQKNAVLTAVGNYCYVWTAQENIDESSVSSTDNKLTSAQSKAVSDKFDALYLPETTIFGNKYSSQYPSYIAPKEKISILLYDIDEDYTASQNSGIFGFFWAKDFYTGGTDGSIPGYNIKTNEDELFYCDAHFLDSYAQGIYSTLAHEFQHMLDFIQKSIVNNASPDLWYNEMLSMIGEDLVSSYIGIGEEDGPQSRMYDFVASYYESGLTDWLSGQNVLKSYAGAYAFGAFLTRNYGGAKLINDIALNSSVNQTSVTAALKISSAYSNETFETVFKSYGRALCYPDIPSSYNVPSLNVKSSVTVGSFLYTVFPINLQNYYYYTQTGKNTGLLKFDTSVNGSVDLRPYGFSVHYWGKGLNTVTLNFSPSLSSTEKVYIIVE